MTSSRPLPDDVEVGLLVDSVTGGNFIRVDVEADYATEGRWSPCRPESAWHFNLHPEHMYDLHSAEPDVTWREYGFEVDGGRVLLGWDDREDLDAFASLVARTMDSWERAATGAGRTRAPVLGRRPRSGPRRSFLLRIGARGCPRGVLLRVRVVL